jgi:hypothetical protein
MMRKALMILALLGSTAVFAVDKPIMPRTNMLGCSADDCRVCNANGYKCQVAGSGCDCVPWP